MECLICYRVEVNFDAEKYKKSATTFCQVFGLPATSEEPFYSSTVCDLCLQRLADIEVMLREIQQIQENVNKVKDEMERDLLNSQRLSEEESKISEPRVKIINEMTSRGPPSSLEESEGIPVTHFLAPQPSTSSMVQVKLEEDESQPHQMDSDHFQPDFSSPIPENDSSLPLFEFSNALKPLKNALIMLEKLPFLVGGSSINVNQEPIKSYTLRNLPARPNTSNSQMSPNTQKKRGRGNRKVRIEPKKRKKKAKPKTARKMIKRLPRKCTICHKVFNRGVEALNHMNRAHGGEPTFLCQECGKAFFTKRLLKSHLISHGIGKNIVNCLICDKPFHNQARCDKHVSVVHRKEKAYNCSFCDEKFAYQLQLNAHWRVVHLGEAERIPCNEPGCGKEFKTAYQMNTHVKKMHSDPQNFKFSCSECGKKFVWNADLQMHIRRVHLNEKNILCEHCPARFFFNAQLRRHVRFTHLQERPYKCQFCTKGFVHKQKLDKHLLLHSREISFVCQYCGEAFQVETSLKKHMSMKHSDRHLVAYPNQRRKMGRSTRVQVVTEPGFQIQDPMNIS